MKRTSPVRAPYFALVVTLIACSGQTLEVGSNQQASGGNVIVGAGGSANLPAAEDPAPPATPPLPDVPPLPEWPDLSNCEPTASAPITGEWTGYAAGPQPAGSGWSAQFKVTFTGMSGETLCGTVTFGDAEPPPPATAPAEIYPPGALTQGFAGGPGSGTNGYPYQGLPYTMLSPSMEGQRLQFSITYNEIARSWCPLQTSYLNAERTAYNCLPGDSGAYDGACYITDERTGQRLNVSCTQYSWCSVYSVCACVGSGCVASPDTLRTKFDIHVDGDQAQGVADNSTIFLQRLP